MAFEKKKKEAFSPISIFAERKSEFEVEKNRGKKDNPYRVQPVDIQTFVTHKDYLGVHEYGGLSPYQLEFAEAATDMNNDISFCVVLAGKNSGKNFTCAVVFLYTAYKLLCMYDCHEYLGVPKVKELTLMNVSINEMQARKNFFDPLLSLVKKSGDLAFKQFGWSPIDGQTLLTNEVRFPKQKIQLLSMNSKAGNAEGLT